MFPDQIRMRTGEKGLVTYLELGYYNYKKVYPQAPDKRPQSNRQMSRAEGIAVG